MVLVLGVPGLASGPSCDGNMGVSDPRLPVLRELHLGADVVARLVGSSAPALLKAWEDGLSVGVLAIPIEDHRVEPGQP